MIDIEKVDIIMKFLKNKKFSFGDFDGMTAAEDLYYLCKKFKENKIGEEEFLRDLDEGCHCPDLEYGFKIFSCDDVNSDCKLCWKKTLNKE